MRKSRPFIWNATNFTFLMRKRLVDFFISYKGKVRIVYIETPYKIILERNSNRSEPLPEKVLEKMIDKLEVPDITESHAVEYFI